MMAADEEADRRLPPGTRTYARPSHEHALHLRAGWSDELISQIKLVAKRRNMSLTDFVVSLIKRHLAGGAADQPLGLCPVCKRRRRRAALLSPHAAPGRKDGKVKEQAQEKDKEKAKAEAAPQARCPRHGLARHPACVNHDFTHAHGPWWPRAECLDEDRRMRTPGWNQRQSQAAGA